MVNLPCPSCGGELTFKSDSSVFAVCPYCTSSIVRHDLDLEKIGEMGEIQEGASPVQVGMTGRYKNKFFYTSGRIVYEYPDGLWNEWHLYFDTGETGWLTDAQGEFAVSMQIPLEEIPALTEFHLGQSFEVRKSYFTCSDIKTVTYSGSEGELPFKALRDYKSTVYDFSNEDNLFLTVEVPHHAQMERVAYFGNYIDFFKLEPQNIKLFEGWI